MDDVKQCGKNLDAVDCVEIEPVWVKYSHKWVLGVLSIQSSAYMVDSV